MAFKHAVHVTWLHSCISFMEHSCPSCLSRFPFSFAGSTCASISISTLLLSCCETDPTSPSVRCNWCLLTIVLVRSTLASSLKRTEPHPLSCKHTRVLTLWSALSSANPSLPSLSFSLISSVPAVFNVSSAVSGSAANISWISGGGHAEFYIAYMNNRELFWFLYRVE